MGFAKAVWRFGVCSKNFGAASKRILYYMMKHVRSSTKGGRNEGQDKKRRVNCTQTETCSLQFHMKGITDHFDRLFAF